MLILSEFLIFKWYNEPTPEKSICLKLTVYDDQISLIEHDHSDS